MDPVKLLKNIWIGLSTIGTVISIASLFDDLVAWIEFIRSIIVAYREIVDHIWGPILRLAPFHLPRWVHDYLTISALTGGSILWALHNTATKLGFPKMGSALTVFRHVFLDFSVGGNTLRLFREDAMRAARQLDLEAELKDTIVRLARPERALASGLLSGAIFTVLVFAAPFLIPVLMSRLDALGLRHGHQLFQRRAAEIAALTIDPSLAAQWQTSLETRARAYADFGAINTLFYKMVRNSIFAYYAAVAAIFALIVLLNYGVHRVQEVPVTPGNGTTSR